MVQKLFLTDVPLLLLQKNKSQIDNKSKTIKIVVLNVHLTVFKCVFISNFKSPAVCCGLTLCGSLFPCNISSNVLVVSMYLCFCLFF